jgi:crossover junction endodeoxyribonuclease RusA
MIDKVTDFLIEFDVPWPDKYLNPNNFSRWPTAEAKEVAFEYAYYMAKSFTLNSEFRPPEQIAITYTFYPPNVRTRDDDNFIAAMKASRDGVAKALNVDDACFVTQPAQWGSVVRGGKVTLTLVPLGRD